MHSSSIIINSSRIIRRSLHRPGGLVTAQSGAGSPGGGRKKTPGGKNTPGGLFGNTRFGTRRSSKSRPRDDGAKAPGHTNFIVCSTCTQSSMSTASKSGASSSM
eukprot:TRINITY_DN29263_c0_g2_i1.p2 TRINITY_DN29263_c0_g2~~TRINITY_DN29263_c0_g2_i1.p2  ORF type:complete len:104 (-),score=6.70 TRINITY_DN29263_c0_g2_i1:418-729(-)